ncbi:uncharacterized protein B0T15DRAFT_576983 [Chaetomium strumarium]|uniref:NACHT domain-containing protein n=1 Tax=Chaetomium strumarium TaxID=1170767 RepID=A0AAJ0GPE2_9PEZI|nr:hypothetical protein B0T15DRAFT_576983 [Chaetomium strumarium]
MDPLSALSIAAAGVQFVDVGTRLLSDVVEICKSATGQTERVLTLRRLASDLDALTSRIEEKGSQIQLNSLPGSPDCMFLEACRQCKEVSKELADIMQALGLRPVAHRSTFKLEFKFRSAAVKLAAAGRHIVSESKIKDLTSKLMALQAQMQTAALFALWEKAQNEGMTLCQATQQQADMISKIERVDSTTRNMAALLNDVVAGDRSLESATETFGAFWSSSSTRLDLIRAMWSADWSPRTSQLSATDSHFAQAAGLQIINSLAFHSIKDREKSIPQAYRDTFEWAFEPQSGSDGALACLDLGSQVFTTHQSLVEHLSVWAGSHQLLTASFYFWNAGNDLQKSHEGLLRTLLIQCLRQMPDLMPRVFERRWAYMQMVGTDAEHLLPPWEWDELLSCFKSLASYARSEFRLVLFIDGLDEFSGQHEKLVELVKELSGWERLKLCVSSRPWNIFSDAFHRNPSLRLQDLTEHDISRYVTGRFTSEPAFNELRSLHPAEAARLLQEICARADGVFLHISQSARYFLLVLASSSWFDIDMIRMKMTAVTLLLADEDEGSSYHHDFPRLIQSGEAQMVATMRRRLASRTMGLLEISPSGAVQFLHRAVLDWARQESQDDHLTNFKRDVSADFNPHIELLKAQTTKLKAATVHNQASDLLGMGIWTDVPYCLDLAAWVEHNASEPAEPGTMARLIRMLERLDTSQTPTKIV